MEEPPGGTEVDPAAMIAAAGQALRRTGDEGDLDEAHLELTLPSTPTYVGTARAFIAAAARWFGAEEEQVADLKVAVSEACSGAVRASTDSAPVRLLVDAQPHELAVEVVTPAQPPLEEGIGHVDPDLPAPQFEEAVRATVINSLFPDAVFGTGPSGGLTVRFAVSLLPPDQD